MPCTISGTRNGNPNPSCVEVSSPLPQPKTKTSHLPPPTSAQPSPACDPLRDFIVPARYDRLPQRLAVTTMDGLPATPLSSDLSPSAPPPHNSTTDTNGTIRIRNQSRGSNDFPTPDFPPVGSFDRGSEYRANGSHIRLESSPTRPELPDRKSKAFQSNRSLSEALRLARSREEQEMLLGDEELADDDGCYPPRKNDDPWTPNPHAGLPIYTTIHRIRRLVIASIGKRDMTAVLVLEAVFGGRNVMNHLADGRCR